ncbi:MAG: hypothetical protein IT454_14725 [Planctomycetes bacterium]|nr:hypothetical protein [Planctomycetota bacterium]
MPEAARANDAWSRWIPLLSALATAGWVWGVTSFHGPGLDSDSAQYLAAAQSLSQGQGWLGVDGQPYQLWPPLYPALLAALTRCGVELLDAVRVLHSLSAALTIWACAHVTRAVLDSRAVAIAVSLLLPFVVARTATMAWSEPVFVALCACAAVAWERWNAARTPGAWWSLLALSAAIPAQRYVGVVWVACIASALILTERGQVEWSVRLRRTALYCACSALPVLAWFARNAWSTQHLDGRRGPPSDDWRGDALSALREALPLPSNESVWAWVSGALALVCIALGLVRLARDRAVRWRAWPMIVFPFCFAASLVGLRQAVEFDPIDERLMSPAMPFMTVLAVAGAFSLASASRVLSLALLALWALLDAAPRSISRLEHQWQQARTHGPGIYESPDWAASPLVAFVREHRDGVETYSNEPFALSLLASQATTPLPARPGKMPKLFERWRDEPRRRRVVLFRFNPRIQIDWGAYREALDARQVASFADGEVWELGPR